MIDHEPLKPCPRPLIILNIHQTGYLMQTFEMLDPLLRLILDFPLFLLQTLHLALQALHAGDHRV